MGKQEDNSGLEDTLASALSTISSLPIPAPVQKGFLRAVSRLTGALVDIPAAKLESVAEDIRAATEARKLLTVRAAGVLADDFQGNPELAARAQARATAKVLREQVNVEDVLRKAAKNLAESAVEEEPTGEPDEDWWNTFEDEASKKSSDEMKEVFGKILAGEIERPGSFSIRAVRSVGEMDQSTATLFSKLCSISVGVGIDTDVPGLDVARRRMDARVASLGSNAATNGLKDFGLPFSGLQVLEQHGLVNSDFNNWMEYGPFATGPFRVDYINRAHQLVKVRDNAGSLRLHGVSLTRIGNELRDIVGKTEDPKYTSALNEFLASNGYALVPSKAR